MGLLIVTARGRDQAPGSGLGRARGTGPGARGSVYANPARFFTAPGQRSQKIPLSSPVVIVVVIVVVVEIEDDNNYDNNHDNDNEK